MEFSCKGTSAFLELERHCAQRVCTSGRDRDQLPRVVDGGGQCAPFRQWCRNTLTGSVQWPRWACPRTSPPPCPRPAIHLRGSLARTCGPTIAPNRRRIVKDGSLRSWSCPGWGDRFHVAKGDMARSDAASCCTSSHSRGCRGFPARLGAIRSAAVPTGPAPNPGAE